MDQNVSDLEYLRKHIGSGESDYVLSGWLSKDEIDIVRFAEIIRAEATDQSELDMLAKLADPAGVRVMILRGTINVGTLLEDERRNAAEQARREAAELLSKAMKFVKSYANQNPRWTPLNKEMNEQDPNGAHELLDEYKSILQGTTASDRTCETCGYDCPQSGSIRSACMNWTPRQDDQAECQEAFERIAIDRGMNILPGNDGYEYQSAQTEIGWTFFQAAWKEARK